jgi:hypothetical protein
MSEIGRWGLVAVLVSGCSYHAGTFRDHSGPWPGTQTTLGCIDLAVGQVVDRHSVSGTVVAYGVGNRCEHRVVVDLASVRVVARSEDGRAVSLSAYDPHGELRPELLNALWSGRAKILYYHYGDDSGLTSICVDVGRIDRSVAPTERWICTSKEQP